MSPPPSQPTAIPIGPLPLPDPLTSPITVPQRTPDPKLALQPQDHLILRGPRMDYVIRPIPTRSGPPILREVVIHPGTVLILPILPDGRIVLIRNFRHTVQEELWELPAGTLGIGEDPATCAARELTEETGYTASQIAPFGWFFTSPGVLTEKMYVFLATGLKPGPQELEENEKIRVEPLDPQKILSLISENQIADAKTLATLLKYFMTQQKAHPLKLESTSRP